MEYLVFEFKVALDESLWTWTKRLGDVVVQSSSGSFDCLACCLADAQHHGYCGGTVEHAETCRLLSSGSPAA